MAKFRRFRRRFMPFLPTAEAMRRFRRIALRRFGVARTYEPMLLTRHPELCIDNLLRFVAADVAHRRGEIKILQIGAYDGVTDDDLRAVIDNYPTRGILVEPQRAAFTRLQQNYANHPQMTLVNAAIDRTSGTRDFFTPAGGESTMSSFDRGHLRKMGFADRDVATQHVPCYSISELLSEHGFDSIDLIQIDAEGYDYEIIRSIDFAKFKPAILRFEFVHFSTSEIEQCLGMLARTGYRFLTEKKDVIAIQDSASIAVASSATAA